MNAKRYARLPLAIALGAMCLGGASIASAEVTNNMYGNFRWSVNHVDEGGDDTVRADDNQSRLGLRGEVKGSNLTAFYHWETGLTNDAGDTTFSGRLFYAGVKGAFGAATVGRHSPAYKVAGTSVNPFGDTGVAGVTGAYASTGAAYGLSPMTNGFANNTIAYTSPNLGPVTLNAAAYLDDGTANNHDWAAGIAYAGGPFTLGFQYYDADTRVVPGETSSPPWNVSNLKAYRGHGSFTTGPIKLGASVEVIDPKATGAEDQKYYFLAGTYSFTPATRVSATIGVVDEDTVGSTIKGEGFNLGVFHDLLPNTTVYALYSKVNFDLTGQEDTDVVSAGLIYNFNMGL